MSRALVTGGAGFLGAALVDHLLALGQTVVAVDDLSGGSLGRLAAARGRNTERPGAFTFEHLAVGDPAFGDLLVRLRPDVVHHLARDDGPLGPLQAAAAVLDAAAVCGARAVVLASAADVYGVATGPLTERAATDPRTPAAAGRLAAEAYARAARHRGLAVTVLAISDAYGPDAGRGAVHDIAAALRGGWPAPVAARHDLVHADDVAAAFAVAAGLVRPPARRLHIGSGRPVSGPDLHAAIAAALRLVPGPVAAVASQPVLDVRAARQVGWTPSTDLALGLPDAVGERSQRRAR